MLGGLASATTLGTFALVHSRKANSNADKALALQERALELQIQQDRPSHMLGNVLKVPFAVVAGTGKIVLDPLNLTNTSISDTINLLWIGMGGR